MSSLSNLDITSLYYEVKDQNNIIESQTKNMDELFSSDNQNINYKIEQIEYLHSINVLLFYLYFILIVILIILSIIKPTGNLYVQIGAVIIIIIYPFLIYFFERRLYLLFLYLYSIFNGNPYLVIQ